MNYNKSHRVFLHWKAYSEKKIYHQMIGKKLAVEDDLRIIKNYFKKYFLKFCF